MSDNDKKDKDKDPGKKPLKKKRVHVTVNPKDGDWQKKQRSRQIKKRLKEEVEKAVEDAEPDGSDAQFDAADKKLDEAKRAISPKEVREIEVEVEGTREDERGEDEYVSKKRKVKPGD